MVERRDENRFATERVSGEDGRSFKTWESVKKGSLFLLFIFLFYFSFSIALGWGEQCNNLMMQML